MIGVLKNVFRSPQSWLLLLLVGVLIFILATILPNIRLLKVVFASGVISGFEKAGFLFRFVFSSYASMTTLVFASTIVLSLLFGFNTSLLSYVLRTRKKMSGGGVLFGGLASGFIGAGCGACGTLVIAPLLSAIGAGGALAILPLGGQEFIILGVILLAFSSFVLLRRMSSPLLCDVKIKE